MRRCSVRKTRLLLLSIILVVCFALLCGCATTKDPNEGKLRMHFYSTSVSGWGDCTYIEFPNGQNMLIDCGLQKSASEILKDLQDNGVTHIDYFVISHYHSDHVGGLKTILPHISFSEVITTGYYTTDFSWVELNFKQRNAKITYVKAGDSFNVGDVRFDILWPTAEDVAERPQIASGAMIGPGSVFDMNCHSMVMKMTYGDNTALFTGDAYVEAQRAILDLYKDDLSVLDSDVLKIMHHGYSNANGEEAFIKAVSPKYAFSMGTATMEMVNYLYYHKVGAEVYMSWYNGNSWVTMDGENITVETEKPGVNAGYSKYVDAWEKIQGQKSN